MSKKLVCFRLNDESVLALDWAKRKGFSQVDFVEKALTLYYSIELSKENSALQKKELAIQQEVNEGAGVEFK